METGTGERGLPAPGDAVSPASTAALASLQLTPSRAPKPLPSACHMQQTTYGIPCLPKEQFFKVVCKGSKLLGQ